MSKRIVLIGGMGPQAGLALHQQVVHKAVQLGARDGDEFPEILHLSIPVTDFISSGDTAAALRQIEQSLAGITFRPDDCLAIACNTAHLLQKDIEQLAGIKLVSLIDTVAEAVSAHQLQNVGLLASPTTIETKLYEQALNEKQISCTLPTMHERRQLERVIRKVIAGTVDNKGAAKLQYLAMKLMQRGAEGIILGCTELPLAFSRSDFRHPTFDCLDLLAERLLTAANEPAITAKRLNI